MCVDAPLFDCKASFVLTSQYIWAFTTCAAPCFVAARDRLSTVIAPDVHTYLLRVQAFLTSAACKTGLDSCTVEYLNSMSCTGWCHVPDTLSLLVCAPCLRGRPEAQRPAQRSRGTCAVEHITGLLLVIQSSTIFDSVVAWCAVLCC
jgi:hypothetical protein